MKTSRLSLAGGRISRRRKPRQLKGWIRFVRAANRLSHLPNWKTTRANLNRFNAKFRFAANVQPISASGFSKGTMDGYSAALKLFLAYTAAELLAECIGLKIWKWQIHDQELAKTLRKALQNIEINKDQLFKDQPGKRIADFVRSDSSDIFVAAYCIRIMVAHGTFTATGAKAHQAGVRRALLKMADLILDETESKFQVWVEEKLVIKPS